MKYLTINNFIYITHLKNNKDMLFLHSGLWEVYIASINPLAFTDCDNYITCR